MSPLGLDATLPVNGEDESEGKVVGKDRSSAVGNKRKRNSGDGRQPHRHTEVDENVGGPHAQQSEDDRAFRPRFRPGRTANRSEEQEGKQREEGETTKEPQLFGKHREDEVGPHHRDETVRALESLSSTLPEEASRGDGN